ncbi:pickpocket protein 28 [Bombyx mori]|uniref:pickpocket protein 28 n=1 Tax=Bombyx mori TaxID=7091 RepID=UPI00034F754C
MTTHLNGPNNIRPKKISNIRKARAPQSKNQSLDDEEPLSFASDIRQYLQCSTLHGLRYIAEKKLTWFERFFWLAAFSSSLICAGFFILNVYSKWRMSPMIVSINPENMPLHGLPFPAITICNVNQAKKSIAEGYQKYGNSIDKKLLQSVCTTRGDIELFEDDIAGSADWDYTRSFLINVTQPCQEMLALCNWDSEKMNCQDLFNAQLTDEGLCCTFNVVHRKMMFRNPRSLNDLNLTFPLPAVDWTPESGYPADSPMNGFPWRPRGTGTHHGLTLVLDANLAEYFCASTKSIGFKILLHNPTETPKLRNLGEIYGPGIEARVAIKPRILDANPSLQTIDIQKRLCLFSSEKELAFFRTYTIKNCEMECEARALLDVCNCVHYYMPKNKSTRICGKVDAKCYNNMSIVMPEGREVECEECLQACTEIAYVERVSSAPLRNFLVEEIATNAGNKSAEYFTENMLVVHFFFEDNTFLRFTKGEIFGLTEFLSNTGGLLGLCMGFSIMSAVELIYYLTLRALCMARRRPKHPFTN